MKQAKESVALYAFATCPHCDKNALNPVMTIREKIAELQCSNCREMFIGEHDG